MKRILTILVALMMGMAVQVNGLQINASTIERKVSAAQRQQRSAKKHQPKKRSARAPKKHSSTSAHKTDITTWDGLPIITWKQYEQEAKQAVAKQEELQNLINEFFERDPSQLADMDVEYTQGIPNYTQVIGNAKYIYIGEDHNIPVIQEEIQTLIRSIRNAHPGEKILLATEFAYNTHPLINPLHEDGKEWLLDPGYNFIPELAEELHLDTLALDDEIMQVGDGFILIKVGNRYVKIDDESAEQATDLVSDLPEIVLQTTDSQNTHPVMFWATYFSLPNEFFSVMAEADKDPQVKQLKKQFTQQYGRGNENYEFLLGIVEGEIGPEAIIPQEYAEEVDWGLAVQHYLDATQWGVIQRNQQWAQRIKQVEKNYDRIIVWIGYGHLQEEEAAPSLPALLDHVDAIHFFFDPIDENDVSTTHYAYYAKREKAIRDKGLQSDPFELDLQKEDDLIQRMRGRESINFEQTYFAKIQIKESNVGSLPSEATDPQVEFISRRILQLDPVFERAGATLMYNVFIK